MNSSPVTEHLDTSACLALLREAPFGRLAVIVNQRPEIFPVNHAVHHGTVVFRTSTGTKLFGAVGQPVAFEADGYDTRAGRAWSVVVSGSAHEIQKLHDVLDALELPVFPWEGGAKPHFVRIEPESVSGRRFEMRPGAGAPRGGPAAPTGDAG
ncbi:pyridoxamine 5'-phosphate oxidase family protein [Ornithinimicrobium murale]|uniref:pyridoxamine 5'-phosphate oxidase family protein n=1 Tax=Ornithinimicrobium murale TaxID=1050153 RepID=UPI000E0D92A0|nr:pyridoxamine 5'-phosphate oxidase family protein [Ornithinimicrobium murale]